MEIRPISLREAQAFIARHHRHNDPPRGHKFSVALYIDDALAGVACAGRPVAKALDNGLTLEVNRTCTDGAKNANSMLYGAVWRAARAMGYRKCVTYTRADESGASLRAAGWVREEELDARPDWTTSSVKHRAVRDPAQRALFDAKKQTGHVRRVRWSISR